MMCAVSNVEKAWDVRGSNEAAKFNVLGVAPFFYLARAEQDPGGLDREWVYLLGDCRRWGIPADLTLHDGTPLFFYKTPTGNLDRLVKACAEGRCFLIKEDRSIWQVVTFRFDAAGKDPAAALTRRRATHSIPVVTRLAFGDGTEEELVRLAQARSDEELAWAAAEGSSIAKAELERRLARLSAPRGTARDPLTDVETRAQLETYLRDVRERTGVFPVAFLSIDVDTFKSVNDTHGHGAGDRTLRAVALQAATHAYPYPRGQTFRVGGDEFLVVLENCDSTEAAVVGEQIRGGVAQARIPDAKGAFSVSVSVGVVVAKSVAELDNVLDRADGAMYTAKHGGKNRVAPK